VLFLALVLLLIFQAVFAWAAPVQDLIEGAFAGLGAWFNANMSEGLLRSLIVDAMIAGLGSVLVFLPQILILFFFILALEESGYLPRAAFLLDRVMFKAGLTGRSFIPLLSSYACAVPGIMATRSIQDPRDRLTTILVAPLTTCSARLPVYTLLIGAFIPQQTVWGVLNFRGLVLFALYLLGIASVMLVAYVMKRFQRDQSEHALLMELPVYRVPNPRDLAIGLYERTLIFIKRVGGIIFCLTVLLWFLLNFPAAPLDASMPAINYSYAGRIGQAMQWLFAPIGFNWQICIALVPGLAAREVAVSSLATVYALSGSSEATTSQLSDVIAAQWNLPMALSLLAWYVFAPQCLSTLAVIRRETNSWRTMLFSATYLFALAYLASFLTYQIARALTGS
jgi:ferrous iron transport protein B